MTSVGQRGPGSGAPRLLVVEDDPPLGETVEQVLAEAGYAVTCSASGAEALRLARALAPDLILLDVRLPDVSGLAVLDRLAVDEQTRATPVILWTAAATHEADLWRERLSGRRVGFLPKPFRVADLLAALAAELGRPDLADQITR
jgi:CheY-like chemotaxis protein